MRHFSFARSFCPIALLIGLMLASFSARAANEPSSELEKAFLPDRVLLVFVPDKTDRVFLQQNVYLGMATEGMKNRDMAALYVYKNYVEKAFPAQEQLTLNPYQLRTDYEVSDKLFATVIVGRNGVQLHRKFGALRPSEMFEAIDTTPMTTEGAEE
jgi:hypothetical protein